MLNLINFLDLDINDPASLCGADGLGPILKIVGLVVWGVRVAVPIILIVVGMFDLAKAVTEKKEDEIKAAQQKLIKKAIAAVLVFLVITLVGLIMGIIGADDYKQCMECVKHPFRSSVCNSTLRVDDVTSGDY